MTDGRILREVRERVGALSCEMLEQALTRGSGGNVSVCAGDRVAISPSVVAYEDITPESVPVVDLDGERLEGELKPSNESNKSLIGAHPGVGPLVGRSEQSASDALQRRCRRWVRDAAIERLV